MINFLIFYCLAHFTFALINYLASFLMRKEGRKFSFANVFPFECFLKENNYKISALKLLYCIPLLLLIFSSIFIINIEKADIYSGTLPIFIALLVLGSISFMLMLFLNPQNIKIYSLFFILLFVSMIMLLVVVAYTGFISLADKTLVNVDIKKILLGSVSLIFLIAIFVSFIRNKTIIDFSLEKKEKEDGTVSIERPKFFPLAFYQWLSVSSLFASTIFYFLMFI